MKAGKDAEEKEDAIFKTPHSHCIDDAYLVSSCKAVGHRVAIWRIVWIEYVGEFH